MTKEFLKGEIVARPGSSLHSFPLDDILATAQNGKAVRVALNGVAWRVVDNRIRSAVLYRGHRCHIRRDPPDHLIVWVTGPVK